MTTPHPNVFKFVQSSPVGHCPWCGKGGVPVDGERLCESCSRKRYYSHPVVHERIEKKLDYIGAHLLGPDVWRALWEGDEP